MDLTRCYKSTSVFHIYICSFSTKFMLFLFSHYYQFADFVRDTWTSFGWMSVFFTGMRNFIQIRPPLWRHIDFQNGGHGVTGLVFGDVTRSRISTSVCTPNFYQIYTTYLNPRLIIYCVQRKPQCFCNIYTTTLGWFWWNLVHSFLNNLPQNYVHVFYLTWIISPHYLLVKVEIIGVAGGALGARAAAPPGRKFLA